MKVTRRLLLVVTAMLVHTTGGYALEELVVIAPQVDEATRREARQKYLDKLIASIHKSCNLTETELRRLQVASKGAVEYSFEQERSPTRPRIREIEWGLVPERGSMSANDISAAARHPIWTTTIERMLSGDRIAAAKTLAEQQLAEFQRVDPRLRRFRNAGFDQNGKIRRGELRLPAQILGELRRAEAPAPGIRPQRRGR